MDTAKAAGALLARPKRTLLGMTGFMRVRRELPPLIAIPTTAGSGSEAMMTAVIAEQDAKRKIVIMDMNLMPKYAILDPNMTTGLTPELTVTTGMDALVHALEAYLSHRSRSGGADQLAEDAIRVLFQYLERAYQNGRDGEARAQMQIAAFKAGFAFSRVGEGNINAIAHALSGLYNTPHGRTSAVILPYVLRDYGAAVYGKLAHLAEILGILLEGTEEEKAAAFIAEVEAMNERMGIPRGFDFIRDEDIEQMSAWALREANFMYPVLQVYTGEHFRELIGKMRIPTEAEE